MLVKSITEEEIYGIGHAFGFYDYGEETGMTAAFSGREATADYCLLRNDFWKTVRSFAIAEELLVWAVDLSIGKPFSLSPGNILGYGAAFFLCQARHDGEQQFALAVKGVDFLLFEVDFYAFFFQFADGNQTVNRVSGEAADRLCDDEVDFTGHGIGDHFINVAWSMIGSCVPSA